MTIPNIGSLDHGTYEFDEDVLKKLEAIQIEIT